MMRVLCVLFGVLWAGVAAAQPQVTGPFVPNTCTADQMLSWNATTGVWECDSAVSITSAVIPTLQLGAAGVQLTADGDGAIAFLGLGNGSDEDLTLNLDDTADTGVFTSSTGLVTLNFSSIALQESGVGVVNLDEIDASSELAAIIDDETGSGLIVFDTSPTITTPIFGSTITVGLAAADDTFVVDPPAKGAGQFAGTLSFTDLTGARAWILPNEDVTAADFAKITGITDGTGSANNALVLDANLDIVAGLRNATLAGWINASAQSTITDATTAFQGVFSGGAGNGGGIRFNTDLAGATRRNWGFRTDETYSGDFALLRSTTAGGAPNIVTARFDNAGNMIIGGTTTPNYMLEVRGIVGFGRTVPLHANVGVHIGGANIADYDMIADPATSYGTASEYVFKLAGGNSGSVFANYTKGWVYDDGSTRTLTNLYGYYIDAPASGGTLSVTNAYGLVVKAPTVGGTINTGIRNEGTLDQQAAASFAGNVSFSAQDYTIADDAAGTKPAQTVTPTSSYVTVTCNDATGCTMTMDETGMVAGMVVTLRSAGTGNAEFADSAGVLELASGAAFVAGANDTLRLLYTGAAWVELSRADN